MAKKVVNDVEAEGKSSTVEPSSSGELNANLSIW